MYKVVIQKIPVNMFLFNETTIDKKNDCLLFTRLYKTSHGAFLGLFREINKIRVNKNIEPYFYITNTEKGNLDIPVVPFTDAFREVPDGK